MQRGGMLWTTAKHKGHSGDSKQSSDWPRPEWKQHHSLSLLLERHRRKGGRGFFERPMRDVVAWIRLPPRAA